MMNGRRAKFARALGLVTALLATQLLQGSAQAQQDIKIHDLRGELHLGLGWRSQVGFGGRVDIPIVPEGLVEGVEDELALSPGAELYFDDDRDDDDDVALAAVVAAQWNFYLHPQWSVFPELGLALIAGDRGRRDDDDVRLRLLLAVGGRYHFSSRNSLVLRICSPFGVQIGITF
jgi:hypothetical protein